MPNGRSGGFIIETAYLKELVKTVPEIAVAGQIVVGSLRPRDANPAELARFIEECPHEQGAVEEQDRSFYIVHLRNEPDVIWVVVGSEAPIFPGLRQRHAQWIAEHPGWAGWLAF